MRIFLFLALLACTLPSAATFRQLGPSLLYTDCVVYLTTPFPFVQQQRPITCGAACMRSFLLRQGQAYPERFLAQLLLVDPLGGNFYPQMQRVLANFGFASDVLRWQQKHDLMFYLAQEHAIFVMWNDGGQPHWSLLVSATPSHVILMNPWITHHGYQTISWTEFYRGWWDGGHHQGHILMVR